MKTRIAFLVSCFAAALLPGACSSNGGDDADGASHWLDCDADAECPSGLFCDEGRCVGGSLSSPGDDAGRSLEPCDPGDDACVCGFGAAELLAKIPGGFPDLLTHPFDVRYDAAGGAVVAWLEVAGASRPGPIQTRYLDPDSETWRETQEAFGEAKTLLLRHDAAGTVSLLSDRPASLGSVDSTAAGVGWRQFDSAARTWSPPITVGTALTALKGHLIVTPDGETYFIDYPAVMRLRDGAWESWGDPDTLDGLGRDDVGNNMHFTASEGGHLLATWQSFAEERIYARYFDGSLGRWDAVEEIAGPDLQVGAAVFGADGTAYVSLVDADEALVIFQRDASTGTWTRVLRVTGLVHRNTAGEVYALDVNFHGDPQRPAGPITVATFDRATGSWSEPRTLADGAVYSPLSAVDGDQVLVYWRPCPPTDVCKLTSLHFDGAETWTGPVLSPMASEWDRPQVPYPDIGANGTAVGAQFSAPMPSTVEALRFEPATGFQEPELLFALEPTEFPIYRPRVSVDSRGYATVVWAVATDPTVPSEQSPAELYASRWACRR